MVVALPTLPASAEAPKLGGTLTYVIAADAPPSFDAHREAATVYSGAFAMIRSICHSDIPTSP
jgi:hypothetical protein